MKKNILILTLTFLISNLNFPSFAYQNRRPAQTTSTTDSSSDSIATLSVTGNGISSETEPDLAELSIYIETEGKTSSDATSKNATLSQAVLSTLSGLGIPKDDIKTISFNVNPKYDFSNGQNKVIGYIASNILQVEVSSSKVGNVIDAVTENNVSVNGVNFKITDANRDKKEQEALNSAMKNARSKADAIAMAAGVTITGVKNISEGSSFSPVPFVAGAADTKEASTEIIPGDITVSSSVSVTYTISN